MDVAARFGDSAAARNSAKIAVIRERVSPIPFRMRAAKAHFGFPLGKLADQRKAGL